ncbi:MAG: MATE family efflux transporter [Proteobacteria bacterium]|nr:MATE family efflux transporter [Pseudomonadota bacterium]MDA1302233.1 MATE family efflux transporter [Pseudomonadota bacterium]
MAGQSRAAVVSESGQLLKLALPLVGAQLAQMGMGVTDAIMAGQYSSVDLAGIALAGSVMWPVIMVTMGLLQAVTPVISQLNGSGRLEEAGEVIRQGLWLAACGAVFAVLVLNNMDHAYAAMGVDPAATVIAVAYLQAASYGVPALMIFFCLRFLADGMGFTRPALIISVTALACKIPLNYVLIYGKFGLPALGGVGCGVAQAVIMWLQLGLIILVVTQDRFRITEWMARFSLPDWRRIGPLLRIGVPISATMLAQMGLFSVTTLLLGRFGSDVVAAHNIAFNINGVMFMPPLALGMAATIRIGYHVGGEQLLTARTTATLAIAGTVLVAVAGSLTIALLKSDMVALYTRETQVGELATTLLLFVVFFLIFDALQSTALGCLRGYKDTRIPMAIALVSYWGIGLPLECALGFGWFGEPMGVYGFWVGLATGLGCAAIALVTRLWFLSADFRAIRNLAR